MKNLFAYTALLLLTFASACKQQSQSIPGIEGNDYSHLIQEQKGRAVIVNVWATWCPPCVAEMPGLIQAARESKSSDLKVILISADAMDLRDTAVLDFLKKVGVAPGDKTNSITSYIESGDPQGLIDAVDPQWGGELPFTAVYDRTGKKIYAKGNPLTKEEFAKLISTALKAESK